MAPVGQQHFGRRHRRQQIRRPRMVSDMASGAEQAAGAPLAVANGMQPRVQPAFGASDMPGRAPAEQTGRRSVRLQMGRVDHESAVSAPPFAGSTKMRPNTPSPLQRMKRLQIVLCGP